MEQNSFVGDIRPNFNLSNEESPFEKLFREYERVVFRSLVTSFGLDLFIKDQYGGDVDTILTVRNIGEDEKLSYKNPKNKSEYEERESYSHKNVEGPETNFQRIKHTARENYNNDNANTVQDAYENKQLHFLGKSKHHPTDKSAELDHVISAKGISEDRGRILSGCSTAELADAEDNLRWTNEHLNKSMGADEIPDYIKKHPELPEETKVRMMDAYSQAKATYEETIERAYYYNFSNPNCRRFYKDSAQAALKRGWEMSLRQAIGLLLSELWFSVKSEIKRADGTTKGCIEAIVSGLKKGIESIRTNYKDIITKFGEGFISGIIASVASTICNMFMVTSKNLGRIIRQAWSSIVEAISVLLFNPNEKYFCDRMNASAKILASGASVIVGTSIQESVLLKLSEVPIPVSLKNLISAFAGTLATGLLSVTFLFYIDNNPFDLVLDEIYGKNVRILQEQYKQFFEYCAQLQNVDVTRLAKESDAILKLTSRLCEVVDSEQLNTVLLNATSELGITLLWEGSSLNDKMKDPSWILTVS